jgi:hypothetical protein
MEKKNPPSKKRKMEVNANAQEDVVQSELQHWREAAAAATSALEKTQAELVEKEAAFADYAAALKARETEKQVAIAGKNPDTIENIENMRKRLDAIENKGNLLETKITDIDEFIRSQDPIIKATVAGVMQNIRTEIEKQTRQQRDLHDGKQTRRVSDNPRLNEEKEEEEEEDVPITPRMKFINAIDYNVTGRDKVYGLTVLQLKILAKRVGMGIASTMKRADIINLLRKNRSTIENFLRKNPSYQYPDQ